MNKDSGIISIAYGYTLCELIIALACVTALLAATVPDVYHIQEEWRLWESAHVLRNSLQWGRMHAVSVNSSMMLQIEDNGRKLLWVESSSGIQYKNSEQHLPGRIRIVEFPKHPLHFHPRGNAVPGGTYKVQGNSGAYYVVVSPGGRIRIEKE